MNLEKKKVKLSPRIIINSFLDVIGEYGTLIMPVFNFEFKEKKFFSINNTKSKMGVLTEDFRCNYQIIRTGHPMYSFAVYGHDASKFSVDNFSAYGQGSPFDILRKLNGKIGILDLSDQNSMTFFHHIEEMNNINWRYHKIFKGNYEDAEGKIKLKQYSVFVRKLDQGIITSVNPAGKLLWNEGLYQGLSPNSNNGLRIANSMEVFNFFTDIILSGKAQGLLYKKILLDKKI